MSLHEDVLFDPRLNQEWHMLPCERTTLIYLLQRLTPDVSIEIGTFRGGSLRPISAHSRRVFTFDIDANQHRIKPQFPNAEFVTGDTAQTLPEVIRQLNQEGAEINFVLVDGSHEEAGVLADLTNCLEIVPRNRPCVILMHDSFNPAVRAGILKAPWSKNPHVQGVDIDFVPGALYDRQDIAGQLWGGLALAVLTPEPRPGGADTPAPMFSKFDHSRNVLLEKSIY